MLVGALALGAAVVPPAASAAPAYSPASVSAAAVSCNRNHAYTFHVPGSVGSGLVYLNVGGGSHKGAEVITWPWSGGKGNEKWCLTPGPKGYGWNLRPWDNRSLCLDVPAARYKKGQGLIVWNCNNGKNQVFYLQPVSTDGGTFQYTIMGPWEKQGLKIHRGANGRGSQVSLWPHLNQNARWQ